MRSLCSETRVHDEQAPTANVLSAYANAPGQLQQATWTEAARRHLEQQGMLPVDHWVPDGNDMRHTKSAKGKADKQTAWSICQRRPGVQARGLKAEDRDRWQVDCWQPRTASMRLRPARCKYWACHMRDAEQATTTCAMQRAHCHHLVEPIATSSTRSGCHSCARRTATNTAGTCESAWSSQLRWP
jgi:Protein  of unknown function (DUF3018)